MEKNIISQVFIKFLGVFISLTWTVLFARFVDVDARGDVVFVMGVLVVLISVLTLGAPALITRGISSSNLKVPDSHFISIIISLIVCVPSSIIFIFLSGINDLIINIFFIAAIYCQIFFIFQQSILFSLKRQKAVYIIELISKIIAFYVYMQTDRGVTSYYICFMMSFVISSALVFCTYRFGLSWANTLVFIKTNFRDGILLFTINLAIYLLIKSDILVLGSLFSSYDVGIYSVALSFCDFLILFNSIIGNIFFPKISSYPDIGDKKSLLKTYLYNLTTFYALVGIVVLFISEFIIRISFGEKYIDSAALLDILFFSYIFISLMGICNNYLASIGIPKEVIIAIIIVLLAKIVVIFFLKDVLFLLSVAYINLACSVLLLSFYVFYTFKKT
jgi:O-antigen/teichoic acid export membrane protein